MLQGVIAALVFLTVVLGILGLYMVVAQSADREQLKIIRYRVDTLLRPAARGARFRPDDLFKEESSQSTVRRLLAALPRVRSLQLALHQAEWNISVVGFAARSALFAGGIMLLTTLVWRNLILAAVLAGLAACLPYLYLTRRRGKRFYKFVEQLPDAIDLLGRAVRAGHAVVAGFHMVAEEMELPISGEFRQVHEEQRFGLPLPQALVNLQERIPVMDVRMLVTAIVLQREVGGNLAEVLDKIAHTIRERFKIRRQVKIYTAQGRLTGYILAALPILMAFALSMVNPSYFKTIFSEDLGFLMLGLAALLEIMGYFWIQKIIRIKI